MSNNIIMWPSKFTKSDVRKELVADGIDRKSIWKYGDFYIWYLHLAKQKSTGGWMSTAENGRVNIWYQDKKDAVIFEMLGEFTHTPAEDKPLLVFASQDEGSEYEFKGVFKCYDTDDGVIDHVFKRISKGFDVDEMKPV